MHKTFIVQRLACGATPTEIQTEMREQFSIEVPLSTIVYYDPTSAGTNVSKKLRRLFEETRKQWFSDTASIAIAHRAVRIRELWELYKTDKKRGATALAAQHLAQIAKEMGDFYTNRRMIVPGDASGLAAELAKILGVSSEDLLGALGGDA